MSSEQIGTRIKVIRINNKISQEELADICGINKATLCRIEKGERDPAVKTLFRIAKGLNVTLSDILDLDAEYRAKDTDETIMCELLKYMKKLDTAEQNYVLDMVRGLAHLKVK